MYWFIGLLGILFGGAPYLLDYSNNQSALWVSLLIGLGAILLAAAEAYERDKDSIEYWAAGVLGVLAIAAPFVLRFNNISEAMWASIVAGVLLVIGSASRLVVSDNMSYGK